MKEHQADVLGVYRMIDSYNDRPVYKQDGGENYIYYSAASSSWLVGPVDIAIINTIIITIINIIITIVGQPLCHLTLLSAPVDANRGLFAPLPRLCLVRTEDTRDTLPRANGAPLGVFASPILFVRLHIPLSTGWGGPVADPITWSNFLKKQLLNATFKKSF